MKGLLILVILWAGTSFAQSPFDGNVRCSLRRRPSPKKNMLFMVLYV
jgi:hypothetical protein